ncbi:MAG: HPr family phosphocarrier protein [Ferrimicrobium sp.]|uniref:Phosphocarrier protein HPr n=1 Tax=Ferrimicrobium acidiphilum TaxID=121039 RepID=A0ABV3Y3C5_9ACTN|nr:HPr family phosphocarrier protein [Ferrimicrobium sp.]MCL5973382.1 HPr family phosphocarrier protein [Actinomycetota bacterium]
MRAIDPSGLHARPAARLVKTMNAAGVTGTVAKGERVADLHSILEILALGIDRGDIVELELSEGEAEVLERLQDIFEVVEPA